MSKKNNLASYFDLIAKSREYWIKKNSYYYSFIEKIVKFNVPKESSVLEAGCGIGNLTESLPNNSKFGVDISREMIKIARRQDKFTKYSIKDIEHDQVPGSYDWILAVNLVGYLRDIHKVFLNLKPNVGSDTRILVVFHNHLWEPILKLAEKIGLRQAQLELNWLSVDDLRGLFELLDYEIIRTDYRMLLPFHVPVLSTIVNNFVAKLPVVRNLSLIQTMVLRIRPPKREYSVSIIVPARNEQGNISKIVSSIPKFGKQQEVIFVEGHSKDNTWEAIRREENKKHAIRVRAFKQKGIGKADAVRFGFDKATGEILMILDADLTVSPTDLKKFYDAISTGKCEFANGSRLVYPMEKDAMRFLNKVGNKIFSWFFTFILGQRFKDTLCGTKALSKNNYLKIKRGRSYFGEFDPFGDFDLIFGAVKLNLKVMEIPVRYGERQYGATNISRFKHGWLLLRMALFAFRKFIIY